VTLRFQTIGVHVRAVYMQSYGCHVWGCEETEFILRKAVMVLHVHLPRDTLPAISHVDTD
jgi:hypothetical protein